MGRLGLLRPALMRLEVEVCRAADALGPEWDPLFEACRRRPVVTGVVPRQRRSRPAARRRAGLRCYERRGRPRRPDPDAAGLTAGAGYRSRRHTPACFSRCSAPEPTGPCVAGSARHSAALPGAGLSRGSRRWTRPGRNCPRFGQGCAGCRARCAAASPISGNWYEPVQDGWEGYLAARPGRLARDDPAQDPGRCPRPGAPPRTGPRPRRARPCARRVRGRLCPELETARAVPGVQPHPVHRFGRRPGRCGLP